MSSIVKGVKKVFKKVAKVVKKIAAPALAAAAVIFTGGAALGLGAMAGGWSAAAATVTSSLGLTGAAGAVVTGAITQAGYGALIGGAASALSGGSFSKGARQGAAAGAVTGGLLSGINQAVNAGKVGATASKAPVSLDASGKVIPTPESVRTFALPETGQSASATAAASAAPAATKGGLLSRAGRFLKDNPELTGNIVKGVGTGLLAGAEADAQRDLMRARYDRVAENYETDPGRRFRDAAPGSGETPIRRFDPSRYGSFRYEYNTGTGRIERVPIEG